MKLGVAGIIGVVFRSLWWLHLIYALLAIAAIAWAMTTLSCGLGRPASAARAIAYEALYATARGVRVGYQVCGREAVQRRDLALERRCAAAYGHARAGLAEVEATLDESAGEGRIGCAAGHALAGAVELSAALGAAGIEVPAALREGRAVVARLAALAAGSCGAVDAGAGPVQDADAAEAPPPRAVPGAAVDSGAGAALPAPASSDADGAP